MAKDTIALISTYIHPSRDSIEQMVRKAFPEFAIDNIFTLELAKAHREWALPNLWYIAREYGSNVVQGLTPWRERYFQTTFFFKRIRAEIRRHIDPQRHVFSLQMQSQYDTSVPGLPHFVYTDHTHLSNLASPYFDRRLLRPQQWIDLERTIYANATRVFTRSSDVTHDLATHYGIDPGKVDCIYTGSNVSVDPDFTSTNSHYTNRHILFVGGDWDRKGGPVLLEAFEQVLKAFPDAHLTIAGARPDIAHPNITVLGQIPLAQLTAQYAKASVFCLPTRLEPFGIAFVEAMMHKLPIVATRVGAVPDMVLDNRTGRLVEPGDASQLAHALLEVIGNPERARVFGEAGHRRAVDNYTWDRVGERMRAAVMKAIAPR